MGQPRIISLLPSSSEIACALGLREALVGRSHECDHPPGIETLPVCTRAVFDDGTSHEIDERVKELVRRALSVYQVDGERLRALRPTHILTQLQCEVCAASPKDVEVAVADWTGERPEIVSLEPATLGDVWGDIRRVGDALGVARRAAELAAALTDSITEIGEQTGALARPSVACIEWLDPLMCAGNWVPELVALAGGRDVLGRTGGHAPWLDWDELVRADPDIIVLLPCGFDMARTRSELRPLVEHARWRELSAVVAGRVFVTDGNAYFNRPGPRLVESLEILAEILHPDRFAFAHRGRGWEPL